MYINKDKRKKRTKLYKILKLDIHGFILKKKRISMAFYMVYSRIILYHFMFLNGIIQEFKMRSLFFRRFNGFINHKINIYTLVNIFGIKKKNPKMIFNRKRKTELDLVYKNYFNLFSREKNQIISKEIISRRVYKRGRNNGIKKIFNKKYNLINAKTVDKLNSHRIFFHLYLSVTKYQYFLYNKIAKGKTGKYIDNFYNLIESRIDMLIYRAYSNLSVHFIKQLILHKKIYVNNQKISFSSFLLKKNDFISFCNLNNLKNYEVFYDTYFFMLTQILSFKHSFFLFKYPKYMIVDFNFLLILFFDDKFDHKSIPNFFKYDLKNFSRISFR